ncbi:MAG: glutamine-hydrolyzing carbamoyl-phosphate synthase small subunit [Gammaproteobacteria bacterium]|nr:glutamine-hydrolyzing carbamoyl-phosphate synthase small subunit [Gammaproteobacteria bacterium]
MPQPALLALEDGSLFEGISIGVSGQTVGEVVFNTALTGYQEILSDPSYARQIVTLTYPHIGNVGTTSEDMESKKAHAAGLVIRDLPLLMSNWRAQQTLPEFLEKHKVVAIAGIDTRRLTRILREKGAQRGCIVAVEKGQRINKKDAVAAAQAFAGLAGMDLAKTVTTRKQYDWNESSWSLDKGYKPLTDARFHVVAYDFGVKHNILRMLADRGCKLTVVPAKTPAEEVLAMKPDGVFLSNGPGDPEPCDYAIEAIGKVLEKKLPVFGICLGHQLLALASGAQTMKMKFGHHGANHPVQDLETKQVMITSQNHGFAVNEDSLPGNLEVTHRSLFDQTIQGIRRTDCPAFSFQGHPEASPGPHDVAPLFDQFIASMQEAK